MQGKKHYQEKLFTSFQLSERVPEDNFYRRLDNVIDLRWLYSATSKYYGKEGQKSIDPVVFFKLILIGYLENLCSDRRIISTVSMRMDMLYFIGYDIDEELPWHSTLSRTRKLYDQNVFKELFSRVLKQCIERQMVSGCRQVIDSAYVKANASMSSLVRKEILTDGELYVKELYEQEPGDDHTGSNKHHYSPSDPDARMSTKPGKPTQLNYSAQVSVDAHAHVITSIDAYHADMSDNQCAIQVIEDTMENLNMEGLKVEEIIADSGYCGGDVLQYLVDNDLTGYIPTFRYKPERAGFVYDGQKDEYTCPTGARLPFKGIAKSTNGRTKKIYLSNSKDCKHCPLRSECIGKSCHKKITITQDKHLYEQMHKRMQTRKGKMRMNLRKSTVEPVLGTLINFLGMKKVQTRGIGQTKKCVVMSAVAYNLKKLLKFETPITTEAVVKPIKKRCFFSFKAELQPSTLHIFCTAASYRQYNR